MTDDLEGMGVGDLVQEREVALESLVPDAHLRELRDAYERYRRNFRYQRNFQHRYNAALRETVGMTTTCRAAITALIPYTDDAPDNLGVFLSAVYSKRTPETVIVHDAPFPTSGLGLYLPKNKLLLLSGRLPILVGPGSRGVLVMDGCAENPQPSARCAILAHGDAYAVRLWYSSNIAPIPPEHRLYPFVSDIIAKARTEPELLISKNRVSLANTILNTLSAMSLYSQKRDCYR